MLTERGVMGCVAQSLKPGGRLVGQRGINGLDGSLFQTEAVLTGLMGDEKGGFVKPDFGGQISVRLRPGRKKRGKDQDDRNGMASGNGQHMENVKLPSRIDFTDDFITMVNPGSADGLGDDLIDEDDLLGDDDLERPIIQREWLAREAWLDTVC